VVDAGGRAGPALELRLEVGTPPATLRALLAEDGRFEIGPFAASSFALYVEGGGVHGAWLAAQGEVSAAARKDLGDLRVPASGSLRVQALEPSGDPVLVETVILSGNGTRVGFHGRVEGTGVRFERKSGRCEIEQVWPGRYGVLVRGPRLADARSEVVIAEGRGSEVFLTLTEGCKTFVTAKLARALHPGEKLEVLVGTQAESLELEASAFPHSVDEANVLKFNVGLDPELEWIEVRTSGGLAKREPLTPCLDSPRRRIEFQVGEATPR
jgi:hypothetical protein